MNITTTKISNGHYNISRDDGKQFELTHGVGRWFIGNENGAFATRVTLSVAKYDIKMGYIK